MQLLVTGGAGFIGANLVRHLEGAGHQVTVLDDLSTGSRSNLIGTRCRLVEGSILDPDALQDASAGAESLVHLAARPSVPKSLLDPVASHTVNASGTIAVLERARALGLPVVVASSSSVYGDTQVLPKHEELPVRPLSPYAASKLATESYALAYGASYGLPVLALRFFNVYGPLQSPDHDYAAVVPAFLARALTGKPVQVFGDGQQTRDFTHVETVCSCIRMAVEGAVRSPRPVNLAFGTRVSLLELVAHLESVLGQALTTEHLPARVGDIRDSQAASDSLRALFPDLRPVGLTEGLTETAAWMKTHLQG